MLIIDDLSVRIAGRLLIEHASVRIADGSRIGFVGRNGSGKSTLFNVITHDVAAEHGDIELPSRWRVGRLAQEAPNGPESLIEVVLKADVERTRLLELAETEQDPHEIAEIQMRLADMGAYAAPSRAASILSGLGFSAADQDRPCSEFSGGWRMRVALAATLFAEPDLLLLDEPTNYLDLEGTLWLQDHLARYPRTMIVISHDRDLLNTSVEQIMSLENQTLTLYRGGYDDFERLRGERLMLDQKMAKKQEAQRKHIQAFIDRFKAKASKARQAQSRVKMLEKMAPISHDRHQRRAADQHSRAGQAAVAADRGARRRLGRLRAGQAGAQGPEHADRQRRPHRALGLERQRQVDPGEADRIAARADEGQHHARLAAEDRLLRPASARRTGRRRDRVRTRPRH